MNEQDDLELKRRRLEEKVIESIEKKLTRRYSWIGGIAAATVIPLGILVIQNHLSDARVQLGVARETQEDTTKRLRKALQDLDKLVAKTEASIEQFEADKFLLQQELKEAQRKLEKVNSQANAQRALLAEASTSMLEISDSQNKELTLLLDMFREFGALETLSPVKRRRFEAQLGKIKIALVRGSLEIKKASKAAKRSAYSVSVRKNLNNFQELVEAFKEAGYRPQITKGGMKPEVFYDAVLISEDIPYRIAKELLQKSWEILPSIESIVKGTNFPNSFVVGHAIPSGKKRRTVTSREFAELLASESATQFKERLEKVKSFDW